MQSTTVQDLPMAHMVYFRLADRSSETRRVFLSMCKFYLSNHPGMTHFSIGPRAFDMTRDVNDMGFDVAMNMIFASRAAYDTYRAHQRHQDFITESCGLSTARRVFDTYLVDSEEPSISMPGPKSVSKRGRRR